MNFISANSCQLSSPAFYSKQINRVKDGPKEFAFYLSLRAEVTGGSLLNIIQFSFDSIRTPIMFVDGFQIGSFCVTFQDFVICFVLFKGGHGRNKNSVFRRIQRNFDG